MAWLDGILLTYIVVHLFGLLSQSTGKEDDAETQFRWEIALPFGKYGFNHCHRSLCVDFLGLPAFAFDVLLFSIFGRILIALIFLPKVYDKGLTVYKSWQVIRAYLQVSELSQYSIALAKSYPSVSTFSGCVLVPVFGYFYLLVYSSNVLRHFCTR